MASHTKIEKKICDVPTKASSSGVVSESKRSGPTALTCHTKMEKEVGDVSESKRNATHALTCQQELIDTLRARSRELGLYTDDHGHLVLPDGTTTTWSAWIYNNTITLTG